MKTKTHEINLQQIRMSALEYQVLALRAQTRTLGVLSTEHSGGIDLGGDLEFDWLRSQTEDLVSSARTFAKGAQKMSADEIKRTLANLHSTKDSIVVAADKLEGSVGRRAEKRVVDELDGATPPDHGVIPEDTEGLVAKARVTCLRAECEQLSTFVYQVKAACDLALELAYMAASETEPSEPSTDSGNEPSHYFG